MADNRKRWANERNRVSDGDIPADLTEAGIREHEAREAAEGAVKTTEYALRDIAANAAQTARTAREAHPLKQWKLSPIDMQSLDK